MIAFKKKYFLIIKSIKDIDLRNIKKRHKFVIIYRNSKIIKETTDLINFRKKCKCKDIDFFVANNCKLAINLKSDGLYVSANNKNLKFLRLRRRNFSIIGSAHNISEINLKKKQACEYILLSRLFTVSYKPSLKTLGIIKFNNFIKDKNKTIIPLGGINYSNINKLRLVKSEGLAIMSEIKKKPAIASRLF